MKYSWRMENISRNILSDWLSTILRLVNIIALKLYGINNKNFLKTGWTILFKHFFAALDVTISHSTIGFAVWRSMYWSNRHKKSEIAQQYQNKHLV